MFLFERKVTLYDVCNEARPCMNGLCQHVVLTLPTSVPIYSATKLAARRLSALNTSSVNGEIDAVSSHGVVHLTFFDAL